MCDKYWFLLLDSVSVQLDDKYKTNACYCFVGARREIHMKKYLLIAMLVFVISASVVYAAQPREGISAGLVLGLPFHSAVTGEYNFGPASVSLAAGYGRTSLLVRLGGDYHFLTPFVQSDWNVDLYLSAGAYLDLYLFGGSNIVGIGVPVTLSYSFADIPVRIFAKVGPEYLIPGGMELYGSLGVLYDLQEL